MAMLLGSQGRADALKARRARFEICDLHDAIVSQHGSAGISVARYRLLQAAQILLVSKLPSTSCVISVSAAAKSTASSAGLPSRMANCGP